MNLRTKSITLALAALCLAACQNKTVNVSNDNDFKDNLDIVKET